MCTDCKSCFTQLQSPQLKLPQRKGTFSCPLEKGEPCTHTPVGTGTLEAGVNEWIHVSFCTFVAAETHRSAWQVACGYGPGSGAQETPLGKSHRHCG